MVTRAGGMETESSEDEMVFSSDISNTKAESSEYVPVKRIPSAENNGAPFRNDKTAFNRNAQKFSSSGNRYPPNNMRQSTKFNNQNRSRNNYNRHQSVDTKSSQLLDDLRYAIMQGNMNSVKSIISKGIYADSILKCGWTGLMYASSFGQWEIIEYLLEQGANPNYHKDMYTALMAVCSSKKSEEDLLKCCETLLAAGAKVDAHERHFTTPLMLAVREEYSLIVKVLLDHGADPNLQDSQEKTALSFAASSGYGQIVRLLLEKGADVKICNQMGLSPIDVAYESGHNEVASLLQKGISSIITENCTELVPKKTSSIQEMSKTLRPSDSKNYVKVGELELFLSGLDLSDTIPLFLEHKLSLNDMLIMDDAELEKVGVVQVGVRKKILEACKSVHKKDWEKSSLPNLIQSQYISCPDAVAMMANIAKHLKYISSSVIYIRQQIQSQPRILELSQDSANVYNLIDEMDESLKNVRYLNDELRFLKLHLERVQDQVQYIPADIIVQTIPKGSKHKTVLFAVVGMVTFSVAVAGILWRNPSLFAIVPTSIRVKIPFLT